MSSDHWLSDGLSRLQCLLLGTVSVVFAANAMAQEIKPAGQYVLLSLSEPTAPVVQRKDGTTGVLPLAGITPLTACSKTADLPLPAIALTDGIWMYGDIPLVKVGGKHVDYRSELARAGMVETDAATAFADADEARAERRGRWACASPFAPFERAAARSGVNSRVLYGIAMNESARNGAPWPWTINWNGQGFYFKTRHDAFAAARWLLAKGQRSFDIGLMQVNWKYHGHRFESLWDAFQPAINTRVAADIINENYRSTGTWSMAIRHYHSPGDAARSQRYLNSFNSHFQRSLKSQPLPTGVSKS